MNILNFIRDLILTDKQLKNELDNRIYYYRATENSDTTKTFVLLTPISDEPSDYVSNKYLSENYFVQVDVEAYSHQKAIDITKRIRYLLFQNNMYQASSQLDDYFETTKRYVMSRRYKGVPKNQYYKNEHVE